MERVASLMGMNEGLAQKVGRWESRSFAGEHGTMVTAWVDPPRQIRKGGCSGASLARLLRGQVLASNH